MEDEDDEREDLVGNLMSLHIVASADLGRERERKRVGYGPIV